MCNQTLIGCKSNKLADWCLFSSFVLAAVAAFWFLFYFCYLPYGLDHEMHLKNTNVMNTELLRQT